MKKSHYAVVFVLGIILISSCSKDDSPTGGSGISPAPDTLWTKTFGGSSSDYGRSVQQTSDGGYIITGETGSYGAGGGDVYIIKTDEYGNEEWSQTLGGSYSEEGYCVQQACDGWYIIAGYTESYGAGNDDVYVVKTDASGNEQWSQTFGGSDWDRGYSVQQTSVGGCIDGYIITGYTDSYGTGFYDVYLIKTDDSGIEQWSQTFGGNGCDAGYCVQQTTDEGYIISGWTESFGAGGLDVYLVKTNASGIEQWSQTFGGSSEDLGYSVRQTSDGGYIITGETGSYGAGGWDIYLIKTDASGNEQWSQTFGGSGNEGGFSVQQTGDDGYVIAGSTNSYGAGGSDVYLIKTDASGNEQWSQTFGGSSDDWGLSVQQTSDGGYVIAGSTDSYGAGNSDVWLIRLAGDGGVEP